MIDIGYVRKLLHYSGPSTIINNYELLQVIFIHEALRRACGVLCHAAEKLSTIVI
jgi:hypothetical protein